MQLCRTCSRWSSRPGHLAWRGNGKRKKVAHISSSADFSIVFGVVCSLFDAGQMPKWFISHAWAEPVSEFVQCVARHGQLRDLCETDAWWVCAYANNQHELGKDLSHDPRSSSFFRAMSLCEGLLLILDEKATPFQRIWCCFEQAFALTCKREKRMLLDIATCQKESAILITDGVTKSDLVEKAKTMYRNTGDYEDSVKAHREAHFPIPLILEALTVIDIKNASASEAIDKVRILNTICKAESLEGDPPATSEFYDEVDSELRCIFALAALPACAKCGLTKELESIAAVLQKDTVDRESLRLRMQLIDAMQFFVDFLSVIFFHVYSCKKILPKKLTNHNNWNNWSVHLLS